MANGYNRYESYVPIQWNLPKTDLGVLSNVLDAKQKRFDTGYDLASKLDTLTVDSLPQHRARANAIQQEWETRKQKIVDSYNGDYSAAYRDINALARDINKQLSPGGEANAIITQKATVMDWFDKAQKDKEVNPESVNAAWDYYMNSNSEGYIKDLTKDPRTGSYNITTPEQIIGYTNPDDVVLKAIKELNPNKYSVEQDTVSGNWIVTDKQSGETLDPNQIASTAYRALANDKNYFAGLSQMAKFRGIKDFNPDEQATNLAQGYGKDYSYTKTENSRTLDDRGFELAKYKHDLDKSMFDEINQFRYQEGTLPYGTIGGQKDLTISDLGLGDFETIPLPGYVPLMGSSVTSFNPKSGSTEKLYSGLLNQLDSGAFTQAGGKTYLMKEIIKNNPNTKDIDNLLTLYNKANKEIGTTEQNTFVNMSLPEKKALTEDLMQGYGYRRSNVQMQANPGNVPTTLTADQKEEVMSKFYDKSGKYVGPLLTGPTSSTIGIPGTYLPLPEGGGLIIESPETYSRRFRDVTELGTAKRNINGIAESTLVENHPYYASEADYKNKKISWIPAGTKIRNRVTTPSIKGNRGESVYTGKESIQMYDPTIGSFRTVKTINGNLTPSDLEAFRKDKAIQEEYGIYQQKKDWQTIEFGGNVFKHN